MKRRVLLGASLAAIVAAWGWFVWPTPWRYGVEYWESPFPPHDRNVPVRVRIHRLTGEKQNQGGPSGEWGRFVW